uniref:Uncharacterized protein n=1 Tax=Tanacetum cinerariifolium TaxID=118510 RepID=A0A6L2J4F6_TANCI|nr:hypothetical protein [Tanacetum cinerariifolium]
MSSPRYGETDLHHLDADRKIKEEGKEMCTIGWVVEEEVCPYTQKSTIRVPVHEERSCSQKAKTVKGTLEVKVEKQNSSIEEEDLSQPWKCSCKSRALGNADMVPLFNSTLTGSSRKRARFTTPTSRYKICESSVAAARQIRPTLTIAKSRRADGKLIGRLRRERRYFRTVATIYAQDVAHSRDYCARIMDYCQSREVHTSTLVTQIEALRREVSTLQRQHIENA